MKVSLKSLVLGTVLSSAPVLAQAQSAPPPPDPNPADVQSGTYSVEPLHTRLIFALSHLGFTIWYGEFTHISGSLTLNPKSLGSSTLDITIPANTISTSNTTVDGELNSQKWLDTAKYPTIEFKSTKIARTGHDTARVTGDLTFHGVTKTADTVMSFIHSRLVFILIVVLAVHIGAALRHHFLLRDGILRRMLPISRRR